MEEYSICLEGYENRHERPAESPDYGNIIKEFKEHGFNVTQEALEWVYRFWRADYKSGYRDDKNGFFLFSPCGCNPLRFDISKLKDDCKDWQKTYYC